MPGHRPIPREDIPGQWQELHDSDTIGENPAYCTGLLDMARGLELKGTQVLCNLKGSVRNVHRWNELAGVVSASDSDWKSIETDAG